MEAVGLAFGAMGFAETILRTYEKAKKFVNDIKDFQSDRETIIAKLSAEKAITSHLRNLLFVRSPSVDSPSFFEMLEPNSQRSIYLLFSQFARAIEEYLPLEEQYELSETTNTGHALLSKPMAELLLASREHPDHRNPFSLSWSTSFRWAKRDKKRLVNLHNEFEMWNMKITRFVEQYVLREQILHFPRGQSEIQSRPEAHSLGIEDALAAQTKAVPALTISENAAFQEKEDFKRPWTDLKESRKPEPHWILEIGKFEAHRVVVDSRRYGVAVGQIQKEKSYERLNQLASILQNLHALEDVIPRCLCWIERADRGEFSLLFQIPPSLEPRPNSLHDMLPDNSLSTGPALDERLQIAYRLASTIDRLHSVKWIHKNIRSENILFYHLKASALQAQDVEARILPARWLIYGFEYSRPLDSISSFNADSNFGRNIYRHPQRWGLPTESFAPIHDIYALGVVLLELGLWRKASSIAKPPTTRSADPFQIRSILVERAKSHLGYSAGLAYRNLVLCCLQGHFDLGMLGAQFSSLVVDELRLLAFPGLAASQQLRVDGWNYE